MTDKQPGNIRQLQQVCTELINQRQQALAQKCPNCFGTLVIKNICTVSCNYCNQDYDVQAILKGATNE